MEEGKFRHGIARGLSDHSSMQQSFNFNSSHNFEGSSIKPQSIDPSLESLQNMFNAHLKQCKFWDVEESQPGQFVNICNWEEKSWAHVACVIASIYKICENWGSNWRNFQPRQNEAEESMSQGTNLLASVDEDSASFEGSAALRKECRYCHEDHDEEGNILIWPCRCYLINPKSAWAHRNCIKDYIIAKSEDRCARWKANYSFAPITQKFWSLIKYSNYSSFISEFWAFILCIGVFLFLVAEIILGEVGDEETELWAWVLAAGFVFVIILLFIVIFQTSKGFITSLRESGKLDIKILCQKQEANEIRPGSQEVFYKYLNQQQIPAVHYVQVPVRMGSGTGSVKSKSSPKSSLPVVDEMPDAEEEQYGSILNNLKDEENIDTELMNEHSASLADENFPIEMNSEESDHVPLEPTGRSIM